MIRVSVLMGAFNEAAGVERAIDSLADQGLEDWELVVVDDGSTDGTGAILAGLAHADARIRILRHDRNLGLSASLNAAARVAQADLLARLDADDECLPGRLGRQAEFMRAHREVDVLGGAALEVGLDGRVMGTSYRPETHEALAAQIHRRCPFIHPTVMFRRRFLDAMDGYDQRLRRAQDYDLWLRGYTGSRYHNLRDVLVRYPRKPPRLDDALQSARVLLRAARREGRPLVALLALRPVLAALTRRGGGNRRGDVG